ncbi:hypothetical protein TUZN_1515 [Thermoproteus uzoniensis 768-20]|uniref:Membrane-bound metal-dependent hydrolase n=1 Tax=Thermoproteus uzoniensis (strain 768-20) TaxID=999630 RepID=F2L259_THEU7|nr:DUF1286 domain-containing protein [Thermoproteus uzoniensis]AEA12986.1 hypothetical protein TUZN_1515 [Thermoproteus uzoniensis 768-20]
MLLRTHVVFAIAAGFLALRYLLAVPPAAALAAAAAISLAVNPIVDFLGHEHGRRSPRTHEPLHAAVLGAAVGGVLGLAIPYAAPWAAAAGAVEALSHLFLDAFTEHGIYVRRNGRYKRFAFAHLRYNDPTANGLTAAFSILIIVAVLLQPSLS